MSEESIFISYPSIHVGTDKSEISFHSGIPDLFSLFYSENQKTDHRRFFVTDSNVASLDCMKDFISKFDEGKYGNDILLILGSGEKYKTIETVLNIITAAGEADFTRKDIFVGIGGGVICDITGFAASIFKRGAKVQLVPTTLLAMVDASVGGKTGCDYDSLKNSIGTFSLLKKSISVLILYSISLKLSIIQALQRLLKLPCCWIKTFMKFLKQNQQK